MGWVKAIVILILFLCSTSCAVTPIQAPVQVGPANWPVQTSPVAALAHLSKPGVSLTQEQWKRLDRDIQETLVKRELQHDAIYRDYLNRP